MSKKPTVTLMQKCETKPLQTAVLVTGPEPGTGPSPFSELMASLPGSPEHKAFLLDQVEASRNWGNQILRIESETLIALLEKALQK